MWFLGLQNLTLIVIVRDRDPRVPDAQVENIVRENIEKSLGKVKKPGHLRDSDMTKFINIEVVILSHYIHEHGKFVQEVAKLKTKIQHILNDDDKISGSECVKELKDKWKSISENEEFNGPESKESRIYARCDMLVGNLLKDFHIDMQAKKFVKTLQDCSIENFASKMEEILRPFLERYDKKTEHLDENLTSKKRRDLRSKLLQEMKPAFDFKIEKLRPEMLKELEEVLKPRLKTAKDFSNAVDIIMDCIDHSLIKYKKIYKELMPEDAPWDGSEILLLNELVDESEKIHKTEKGWHTFANVGKGIFVTLSGTMVPIIGGIGAHRAVGWMEEQIANLWYKPPLLNSVGEDVPSCGQDPDGPEEVQARWSPALEALLADVLNQWGTDSKGP